MGHVNCLMKLKNKNKNTTYIHNLEICLRCLFSLTRDYTWCWQMALSEKSFVVKVSIFLSRWKGPWGPMLQCQLIGMINVKRRGRQQHGQLSSSFLLDLDWETKEHWPFLTISSIPNMENQAAKLTTSYT